MDKSDRMLDRVCEYITSNNMFERGDRVLAGISGGADSTCLLLMLCELREKLGITVEVVHVNHGVRVEAGEDAEFVRKMCLRLGVPFTLRCVDMEGYAAQHGLSSEEAGRILRYGIFKEIAENDGMTKIAVAHNSNDRAETMIFNLFRGSGLKGMCGIEPVHGMIVRPLLCMDRKGIEDYLSQRGQPFVTDRTNLTDDYARNRIRHNILTYAEEKICPGTVRHMNETADMMTEIQCYLDRQTGSAFSDDVTKCDNGLEIDMTKLGQLDIVIRKAVVLRCFELLTPHRKDITQVHVQSILELANTGGSAHLDLPYGLVAVKEYGKIRLCRQADELPGADRMIEDDACDGVSIKTEDDTGSEAAVPQMPCTIDVPQMPCTTDVPGEGTFSFAVMEIHGDNDMIDVSQNECTKYFDYDRITSCLLWRGRREGDYLTVDDAQHRQSLKKYMVNQKIPQSVRDHMYVLADGSHILWVPGYRISAYYKITAQTEKILKVQRGNGEINV